MKEYKKFKIVYNLMPDDKDIEIIIPASTYEEACIWAKDYRKESFSCDEIRDDLENA